MDAHKVAAGILDRLGDKGPVGEIANEDDAPVDDGSVGLEAACEDLINAVQSGDKAGVAAAMRSAFMQLESQPHEEDSYDKEEN